MQLLFKFKGCLLKPKPKILYFEFFNIQINHLALHSMIKMALKWDHKNIFNKIIVFNYKVLMLVTERVFWLI
jgi:hypothetical protein